MSAAFQTIGALPASGCYYAPTLWSHDRELQDDLNCAAWWQLKAARSYRKAREARDDGRAEAFRFYSMVAESQARNSREFINAE